jgi:protein tyrosine phosphatase (PTP) superfamily phosphohydrolase (DUF442 family)
MSFGRRRKWALRAILLALTAVGLAVSWNFATGNFGTVIPGQVYRSAQLQPADLGRKVAEHNFRTVLNLRGHHPELGWYRAEREQTLAHGATQVDIAMSSREWMSRQQLRVLIDVLEHSEPPILIHCWRGSERTGLASALATLLREGSTIAEARAQFSARYLFIPSGGGVVTLRHLEQYEAWLNQSGISHTPEALHRWVAEGFVPGHPGREDWPVDPFPLVVTTWPTPEGPVERKVMDDRGRPKVEARRQEAEPALIQR